MSWIDTAKVESKYHYPLGIKIHETPKTNETTINRYNTKIHTTNAIELRLNESRIKTLDIEDLSEGVIKEDT